MIREDIESELERHPFIRFRLHLVSGKVVEVTRPSGVEMLRMSILIFHVPARPKADVGYDVIDLMNIERLEQLETDNFVNGE